MGYFCLKAHIKVQMNHDVLLVIVTGEALALIALSKSQRRGSGCEPVS